MARILIRLVVGYALLVGLVRPSAAQLSGTIVGTTPINFTDIQGTATDLQILDLNLLTTGLTPGRCVQTDATTGKLTVAPAACNTGSSSDGTIHAADYGVVCDGTTDVTAALQAAVTAARYTYVGNALGKRVTMPAGDVCKLSDTIVISNVFSFTLSGNGVTFIWAGPNDRPMFLIQDARESVLHNFKVWVSTSSGPLPTVFQYENGPGTVTPTGNTLQDIFVECTNGGCVQGIRMAQGSGGDNNNDLSVFERVKVNNPSHACVKIEHSQSKTHRLVKFECSLNQGGNHFVHVVDGSFSCEYCEGGGALGADFLIEQGWDSLLIDGGNFEGSKRLLETFGGTYGWPATIRNTRWAQNALHADGRGISFALPGPLILENNSFESSGTLKPFAIHFAPAFGNGPGEFISTGNLIGSTLADPYTWFPPNVSQGNMLYATFDTGDAIPLESQIRLGPLTFAQLSAAPYSTRPNGNMAYCSDCARTQPCTGGGPGALARRLGGAWQCSEGGLTSPPPAQTIAAGNTVAADACGGLKQVTSAAAVTTDTSNTFTAPAAANNGCLMHVCNVGANTITLDNNALFRSAGGADVVLTANDCVGVASNASVWFQVSPLVAN